MVSASTTVDDGAAAPPPPRLLVSLCDRLGSSAKARLVLASQSPRRREILGMMGLEEGRHFFVEVSPLDESQLQRELRGGSGADANATHPVEYTRRLAEAKALALAEAHSGDRHAEGATTAAAGYYLGGDTIVEIDDAILEKPKDPSDAARMLRLMSGRRHRVHTGVALYRLGGDGRPPSFIDSFVDTASVLFADLSDGDIEAYIRSGEPMDKAGSYGIQGIGGQFVTEIQGDFFTVMGLPMHRTSKLLAKALQAE